MTRDIHGRQAKVQLATNSQFCGHIDSVKLHSNFFDWAAFILHHKHYLYDFLID